MGAVGKGSTETYYDFSDKDFLYSDTLGYAVGEDYPWKKAENWWNEHSDISNAKEWGDNLTPDEKNAVQYWVSSGYYKLSELYKTEWDSLPEDKKQKAINLYNALNKFELKKGITVNRATDFKIFGGGNMTAEQLRNFLKNDANGGVLQSDGFMAFSTLKNGVDVESGKVVIHLNVPPNKGYGAYVSNVGMNTGEREYLVNNNAVLKFDPNSVYEASNGQIHVNAKMLGNAKMQTIDSKNKSKYRKEPTPKF